MFEEHLYKLLQAHSRVIIPELGAFLRKDKTDTSEGTLIFSPFLRFNDGLIEEFLTEKEKISKSQASKMVQDFVHKVKDATEKQQTFAVKKMGTFYSDARGTIQFTFVDGAAAIPIKTEPPPKPKDKDKGKDKETPPPPAPVALAGQVQRGGHPFGRPRETTLLAPQRPQATSFTRTDS